MYALRIVIVFSILNILHIVLSETADKEKFGEVEADNIWHKKEDCKKEKDQVLLSDSYERFLKIYENTMKTSKLFIESSDEQKEIMAIDVFKFRKMLEKAENDLSFEEKELVEWVKALESLSESSLRRTLNAMIDGVGFFVSNPNFKNPDFKNSEYQNAERKPADPQAY